MTEQREGMTELGEGKTELDKLIKAAQAVVDICDRKVIIGVLEPVASNCIEALRQAVEQAKGVSVEPDKRIMELEPPSLDFNIVGEIHNINRCHLAVWKNGTPKVGTKLYTTPPSVDALIAEAVAKEREACAVTAWTKGMELHHPVNEPRAREVGSECAKAIRARGNE